MKTAALLLYGLDVTQLLTETVARPLTE